MPGITASARRQFDALARHSDERSYTEALEHLITAIETAGRLIDATPDGGSDAPRPYPALARRRYRWLLQHRYWVAWITDPTAGSVIVGIHDETSSIPTRLSADRTSIVSA